MAVAAGLDFTVLLRNDGQVVACGQNDYGQCDVPHLKLNKYTQVFANAAGHAVLLQSNRRARVCGEPNYTCTVPDLAEDVTIRQVACGFTHTVFLLNDGKAISFGKNDFYECDIPDPEGNVIYMQVAVGNRHTVLLRSDGEVVACGESEFGAHLIPPLKKGLRYTQVAAGHSHTILLLSNGKAVACGPNPRGQCDIPTLDKDAVFTQIACGVAHNVFLQSNGQAKATGVNDQGQCDIPPLVEDTIYTEVAAGMYHTVLLRSDGQVVTCGENAAGQRNIPILPEGVTYGHPLKRYVQISWKASPSESLVCSCTALSGEELGGILCGLDMPVVSLMRRVGKALRIPFVQLVLVLPDGKLLNELQPVTPLSEVVPVEVERHGDAAGPSFDKITLLSAFGTLDVNEEGVIDQADLAAVLKLLDPDVWTDAALEKLLPLVDTNRDGLIQYEELVSWASSESACPPSV